MEKHNWRHRNRTALNLQHQPIQLLKEQYFASTNAAGSGDGSKRIQAECMWWKSAGSGLAVLMNPVIHWPWLPG